MKRWEYLSGMCKEGVVDKGKLTCMVRMDSDECKKPEPCSCERMISLGCRQELEDAIELMEEMP